MLVCGSSSECVTYRVDNWIITSGSVVLDHVNDLQGLVASGVDRVVNLVVRVDGTVDGEILGLLNVELQLLQTSKSDLLQHLPLGSDGDGPISDSLRLRTLSLKGRRELLHNTILEA